VNDAQAKFLQKDRPCNRCGVNPGGKNHPWCKSCQAAYYQERCRKNPERRKMLAEKALDWRKNNRELSLKIIRNNNLKRKFGITIEEWDALHAAQEGKCAICGCGEISLNFKSRKPQRLAVDHYHTTLKNRGLLCSRCNHAIERMETIPDWEVKARTYLNKWISSTAT
jgi:hypothetical protein